MITWFYEMVRGLKIKGKPVWRMIYKLNKLLVNLFYPISQMCKTEKGTDNGSRIIVSLTSFPDRIGTAWITITSLLDQTVRPFKVILWLAEEQFPQHEVPANLERLKKRGLEIRFCEDLKPHKKYYFAMQEFPGYYIITADDDVFYPENLIEQLWKGHEKYPDAVICHWSHKIAVDGQKGFLPYNDWTDNGEERPSYSTLAVGCNGVLYPPSSLPKEAFDKKEIADNAMYTDDLWLKCMEILNGRKTVNCNQTPLIYFNILATKNSGLWKKNTGESRNNDVIWSRLMKKYPEVKDRLMKEV